jgi:hypothetical protein
MDQYKLFVIANLVFGVLLVAFAQVIYRFADLWEALECVVERSASIEAILGIALLVTAVVGGCNYQEKCSPGSFYGSDCYRCVCFAGADHYCWDVPACPYGMPCGDCSGVCLDWCCNRLVFGGELCSFEIKEAK